ncbi:MAG: TIGR02300 family protein [Alphaproteobacteria bacterium]|nr:TIGR02300 family protein [Alphaproteobacteria bacterium]
MTNPKLGIKRKCEECGARFYDLNKKDIICPKCNAVYQSEAKALNAASSAKNDLKKDEINIDDFDENLEINDAETDVDEYIEDVSDLGSDDDDMAEIIENSDTKSMSFD